MNNGVFDKLPPHSQEAEMTVLGSMLLAGYDDPTLFSNIAESLSPDDFFLPKHALLFRRLTGAFEAGKPLDMLTVLQDLKDRGEWQAIGGMAFLDEVAESTPIAINGPFYASIVAEKSRQRKVLSAAFTAAQSLFEPNAQSHDVAGKLVNELLALVTKDNASKPQHIGEIAVEVVEEMKASDGKPPGIATGFADLDSTLCGLQGGDFILIAARPSQGKTSLAMNIAENVARSGKGVAMFSLEMAKRALAKRLISAVSGIDGYVFRSNRPDQNEWAEIESAVRRMKDWPLLIDDTVALTPVMLRSRARQMVDHEGVKLIFVDYIQIMRSAMRHDGENAEITEISRSLKATARELNVPIVALSQLSRDHRDAADSPPRLDRLRGSGSLEQDADVVMFIHRPEYYDTAVRPGESDVVVAKHRSGPTGTVPLVWDARLTKFKDKAPDHVEAYDYAR